MKEIINAGESNPACNEHFDEIVQRAHARRHFLKSSLGLATASVFGSVLAGCGSDGDSAAASTTATAGTTSPTLPFSFASVPVSSADTVAVPTGYSTKVLYAWGDPINGSSPAFKQDASNSAAEQALQCGMHNDGMHFFPFPKGSASSTRGLLCVNHEYSDDGLLHVGGMTPWTAEKVQKAKNAHGVSIVEIEQAGGTWAIKASTYARRVTADTPCILAGPAAGHDLLKTADDPAGTTALGTLNNCSMGYTPWGTYLTCEENWNGYFDNAGTIPTDQARYGIAKDGFGYRWHEFDTRFDAAANPNEPNRFGWVVEIDPFDPASTPRKRTALGRIKHEGATVTLAKDNRVVVYLGDDERNEYIYKFVSNGKYSATGDNSGLLDAGTLYVAKFAADGNGTWLPLVHGSNGLTSTNGFADQGEVLIKTRQAADRLGATMMDRPEWIAIDPKSGKVYVTLTNNNRRGTTPESGNKADGTTVAGSARPAVDAPNPRASNVYGHIVRWSETGDDAAAASFKWDVFVLAGDPVQTTDAKKGNIKGDAFGSPDGLWFDASGILWIQTDVSTSTLGTGDYANLGNNMMLAADPATGTVRRFLTGPKGCEVTGVVSTPDRKSMFVNIQHPGEPASERNDPANPKAVSTWPDGASGGRPRAATIVITKNDGGTIGS